MEHKENYLVKRSIMGDVDKDKLGNCGSGITAAMSSNWYSNITPSMLF